MDLLNWVFSSENVLLAYGIPFLFVLSIVVFFHELGHFLVARWCGVTVTTFSLGFGKEIFGFTDRYGTRWRLAWIPLGGYVKFMDDDNAASAPDFEKIQQMSEAERRGSFHAKPVAQRAAVVVAGPVANFLLAILIFGVMFSVLGQTVRVPRVDIVTPGSPAAVAGMEEGDKILSINGDAIKSFTDVRRIESYSIGTPLEFVVERDGGQLSLTATPIRKAIDGPFSGSVEAGYLGIDVALAPLVGAVRAGSAAEAAGLIRGDRVIAIDGKPIQRFDQVQAIVGPSAGKPLRLTVLRGSETLTLTATPKSGERPKAGGGTETVGLLGVEAMRDPNDWYVVRHDPFSAVWLGVQETYFIIERTLAYIGGVITGQEKADQLGGPLRIAEVSGEVAKSGLLALLNLAAILSVSIGLINLFPIPLLDGGHLMFYAIEAVRGRPLSERTQDIGFRIGLAMVLTLMIFATWNDLIHLRFL